MLNRQKRKGAAMMTLEQQNERLHDEVVETVNRLKKRFGYGYACRFADGTSFLSRRNLWGWKLSMTGIRPRDKGDVYYVTHTGKIMGYKNSRTSILSTYLLSYEVKLTENLQYNEVLLRTLVTNLRKL